MSEKLLAVQAPENPNIPKLSPGDLVNVHLRIQEGNTERIQEFKGTIIRQRSSGNNASFTVRRIASNGIGVERTFLTRSTLPARSVDLIDLIRHLPALANHK